MVMVVVVVVVLVARIIERLCGIAHGDERLILGLICIHTQ